VVHRAADVRIRRVLGLCDFLPVFPDLERQRPEETFWYNLREINADGSPNQWKYVGIIGILFGHFVVPFLFLLSYKHKLQHAKMKFISYWILGVILLDVCYNVLPR
jgi:hypothetical protein